MRIGLGAGAPTIDRIVEQAVEAEAAGFTSMWLPSAVLGDPLTAIAVAGRATSAIELGTAVLVTYAAHPLLTAARAASTAAAMARPGFVLGLVRRTTWPSRGCTACRTSTSGATPRSTRASSPPRC